MRANVFLISLPYMLSYVVLLLLGRGWEGCVVIVFPPSGTGNLGSGTGNLKPGTRNLRCPPLGARRLRVGAGAGRIESKSLESSEHTVTVAQQKTKKWRLRRDRCNSGLSPPLTANVTYTCTWPMLLILVD